MWASLSAGHRMIKMADKQIDTELENRIRAEQVRSAYNSTAPGMTATAVAAMLVGGILVGVDAIGLPLAIAFGGFMLIQVQARLLLISSYRQHQPPDHEWREWSRRFSLGVLAVGLGVGGFAVLVLPPGRLDLQLLILLYVCAVASGAVTAYGVLRPAIYSILPILLLPAGWMMIQGDWLHWVLALIILGWLVAITEQARRVAAQFEESVRLRFENEELIERLTQEKIVAEEASNAKSRFLAAASHDLRQPVHALSLFVAAMRPRVTDPEAVRMLDHIDTSVQAMSGLFDGLLDISRLDAGVVEVNAETFSIQPLLERICRDHASQAEAKCVELRLQAEPRLGVQRSDARGACGTQHRRECDRVHGSRQGARGLPSSRTLAGRAGLGHRPRHSRRRAGAHLPGVLPGREFRARSRARRGPGPCHREAAHRAAEPSAGSSLRTRTRVGVLDHLAVFGCAAGGERDAC